MSSLTVVCASNHRLQGCALLPVRRLIKSWLLNIGVRHVPAAVRCCCRAELSAAAMMSSSASGVKHAEGLCYQAHSTR